jgi:hypothetical protein
MTPSSNPPAAPDVRPPDVPAELVPPSIRPPALTSARTLFWLAIAALGLSVVTVFAMTAYSRDMQHWVEFTTRMYQTTRSALLDVTGPLPRGDSTGMAAFAVNARSAIARFDTVGDSIRDNPLQMQRIRAIRELAGQWSKAIRDRPAAAPGLAAAIESKVEAFLTEEQQLYQVRSDRFHRAQAATAITITVELAFVAAILVAYSRRIAADAAAAAEQQQQLEEQAAQLEEQTMELEIANHELREALARADERRPGSETRDHGATA